MRYSASTHWNGKRWLLVANGAGPQMAVRAMHVAREHAAVDVVVSTGFCGGLDPALEPGDVFVATVVAAADWPAEYAAEPPVTPKAFRSGRLISGDRVARTAEEKSALRARGADAVDMEAAAVARQAAEWCTPFFCVRAVSDSATEEFLCDLNACRDEEGRFLRRRILAGALRHPIAGTAELLRLRRRSLLAAGALGEFLYDCDF